MCPCTQSQKATSPPSQKLCHKTAKEATKEEDPIDMVELVESLFGPKALEYPELSPTRAVAKADESCAAGSDSSDETPLPPQRGGGRQVVRGLYRLVRRL